MKTLEPIAWIMVVCVLFTFGLLAVIATTDIANNSNTDQLTPYESIFPGSNLSPPTSFTCMQRYNSGFENFADNVEVYCSKVDKSSVGMVNITIKSDVVQRLSLNTLDIEIGDLVGRWGKPTSIKPDKHSYVAKWRTDTYIIYATVRRQGWFTYRSKVAFISLILKRQ